jgi:hypothetical protein
MSEFSAGVICDSSFQTVEIFLVGAGRELNLLPPPCNSGALPLSYTPFTGKYALAEGGISQGLEQYVDLNMPRTHDVVPLLDTRDGKEQSFSEKLTTNSKCLRAGRARRGQAGTKDRSSFRLGVGLGLIYFAACAVATRIGVSR